MTADPDRRARARVALVAIGAAVIAYGLLDVLFRSALFWALYPAYPQAGEIVLKALWVAVALAAVSMAAQIVVLAIAVGITIHRRGLNAPSVPPLAITG